MLNRKAYGFYKSYYELAEDMNDEQRGQYYHAILKMQFENIIEIPKDPLAKMAFKGQLYMLNQQLDGFITKKKGSTPTEGAHAGGAEGPSGQVQVQEEVKEKEIVQIKRTLKYRMVDFQSKIFPHISEKFTREDANDFYRYWTEMNEGGYKMRFEKEKTWNTSGRIVTWIKNKKVAPKNSFAPGRKSLDDCDRELLEGIGTNKQRLID